MQLGPLLTAQSDLRKRKGQARAKLRVVRDRAIEAGDQAKAARIERNNLGTAKRDRQNARWRGRVRDITYQAVHEIVDKAAVVAAEDLTKPFAGRKKLGRNASRRLAAWTKGVTAQALHDVPERRGSALVLVNAAYTSQADPRDHCTLGARRGDRLHLSGGVVMCADHAAAINILHRASDPGITLHTPYTRVRQILQDRADRQRTRLPVQKKAVYERFSIESYWVVAPDVDQPELIAFELHDGRYEQVAHVTGSKPFRATRPFDVEVVPAHLVAGLLSG
jgi:IS605 OrfB family transposase